MEITEKHYFNVKEVAVYLGLSRWTIYDLVKQKKIPYIPLSKQALRFSREHIDRWMERQEVKTVKEFILKVS